MLFVEGVGGWEVPVNPRETMVDYAKKIDLPVIMVVGMRLGCLNHALLTARAIRQAGLPLVGWIANCIDPHMDAAEENIQSLKDFLACPCLGVLPWQETPDPESLSKHLDIEALLN
jgi:dethiobiotin synthetase